MRARRMDRLGETWRAGISFGSTSGIITTLGLMVGLNSGTHSRLVVISGILTIAIADALSDALGMHIAEEAENKHTVLEIWESTFATFASKLFFALTFLVPVLLLPLDAAIIAAIGWGLFLLATLSYLIAKAEKEAPWKVIGEHLLISVIVIVVTNFVGSAIRHWFG